jgi:hypothetical protein
MGSSGNNALIDRVALRGFVISFLMEYMLEKVHNPREILNWSYNAEHRNLIIGMLGIREITIEE